MLKKHGKSKKLSQPIVFLAIIGIALGIAVMILSSSVATGFQNQIRNKVIGFGSHVQIESQFGNESFESSPMLIDSSSIKQLNNEEKIKHVQLYAYKPAILQSKNNSIKDQNGKTIRDIEGIIFKGVDQRFDTSFIAANIKSGSFPKFMPNQKNDSIVISNYMAARLQLEVNDKVSTFFMKDQGPKQRILIVSGIYDTGLEDFDKKFGFIDINQIRKINAWGIRTTLTLNQSIIDSALVVVANSFGGNGNYQYNWNNEGYNLANTLKIPLYKDTTISVVSSDFEPSITFEKPAIRSLADTALITIKYTPKNIKAKCNELYFKATQSNTIVYENACFEVSASSTISSGTGKYYCGGIEIILHDYKDLFIGKEIVQNYIGPQYRVSTITERNMEIFNWLKMLDVNVYIIISLMIAVAIINMTAALLVIILEKTQMIGILKSLGASNWSVRKIFIYNGGYLILVGLLIGNALGLSLIFIQSNFELITLNEENYFVRVVPMELPMFNLLLINIGAFVICLTALILPSYFITKISPINAIRKE